VPRVRPFVVAVLILVRHGQTTTNAAGLLVGRSNPSLTELGQHQAAALAPLLGDVRAVWTSPLARARETAALCVPHRTPVVHEAFIEIDYGTMDGQPLASIDGELWASFTRNHDQVFGGGESLADVDARVHPVMDELLDDAASLLHSPDQHLVVVSHVSPIKSCLVWAMDAPGTSHWRSRLSNGSMTTITTRGHQPQLVSFNVVPTLT